MNRRIILCGKTVIIDSDDYDRVMAWKWTYNKSNGSFERRHHVSGSGKNRVRESWSLHRYIMGFPEGKMVDHINRDRLDNRKSNLRICSHHENARNCNKRSTNTSGYKGVTRVGNGWMAQTTVLGTHKYLGWFKDKKEAAKAYNSFAKEQFGEFAALNKIGGSHV